MKKKKNCSASDLFELLAGEVFELRRVGDLVLPLVLALLPPVLQVGRNTTTGRERERWGQNKKVRDGGEGGTRVLALSCKHLILVVSHPFLLMNL